MDEKLADTGRIYTSGKARAMNHPIRVSLVDLIAQGVNTAPKMAAMLKVKRLNLYHHLQILEDEKIIKSETQGKLKIYSIVKGQAKIAADDNENDTILQKFLNHKNILIMADKTKDPRKFKDDMRKLINKYTDFDVDKNMQVLQVQISFLDKETEKERQKLAADYIESTKS